MAHPYTLLNVYKLGYLHTIDSAANVPKIEWRVGVTNAVRGFSNQLVGCFIWPVCRFMLPPSIDQTTQVVPPPARKGGVFVESVDELLDKLKNEAGVL